MRDEGWRDEGWGQMGVGHMGRWVWSDGGRDRAHVLLPDMVLCPNSMPRGKKVQKGGKISYADFVWFLISEEDKKTPTR